MIASTLLAIILLIGAYCDARWRRLPNWLTLGGAAVGLGLALATRGPAGAGDSLLGWVLACLLLFLPFALHGMGAGDVKFLAAVGALRGASFVLYSFIFMALVGGVMALVLLARRGALLPLLRGAWLALRGLVLYRALPPLVVLLPRPALGEAGGLAGGQGKMATLPYGVAIAAGGLLALALGY